MERSNNNYNSIDLFKLIMAICVVAIHTNPLYSCDKAATGQIIVFDC
nr:MAG TPA: acyltransferase family protein [Caudoviricetes sp.]